MVQLVANEYNAAHKEGRAVSWNGLTIAAVRQLCQQQAAQNPKWHPDISSPSLDTYFGEIGPNHIWWNLPPEAAPPADDGAHIIFMSLFEACQVSAVSMADPEPSPTLDLAPPLPTSSRPVRTHRSAKGKEPEVLVDTPPPLQAKASGSLRGTKRRAPSPAPAGPQDVEQDAPTHRDLPQVQVEFPSSQPASPDPQPPTPSTAIGDVSLTVP